MYETGIVVALILWFVYLVLLLVALGSTLERNLNTVGQRLSWLTLTPKPMERADLNRSWFSKVIKFLIIAGIGLPFVFLSWATVVLQAGTFIYVRMKDSGAPQVVRDYRWKMKNREMSFDQIVRELMKLTERESEPFEQVRDQVRQELEERGVVV